MSTLADRIASVRERIATAAARSDRSADAITLVAVSKTVDRPVIEEAAALGLTHFGENRVQDAARRLSDPVADGVTLHLIGQLQTNKARAAAKLFDVVESVDRPNLVETLASEARKLAAGGALHAGNRLPVLLQVNVAREPQKSGCAPEEAADLIRAILDAPSLELRGLMTIAPLSGTAEEARPTFAGLRALRDELASAFPAADLRELSMGMTNDFEVAIEEGATSVRVGRAIFAG